MTTNKLWIGGIPMSATDEYVKQKLSTLCDGVQDVIFDARVGLPFIIYSEYSLVSVSNQ